jgi:hypothetical protein
VRASGDGFATGPLVVHVDPGSLALTVTDAAGHVIVADAGQPIRFDGPSFTMSKALPLGEHIYGMGDKTGTFDRRGESFVDWNTDSYGFQRDTDPIYKSILRPVPRQQLAKLVRFRPPRSGHDRDRGGRGANRLLHHRRPDGARRRSALYRPHRKGADAASLGARLPTVALQLHER